MPFFKSNRHIIIRLFNDLSSSRYYTRNLYDKGDAFDIEKYHERRAKQKITDTFSVVEVIT